MKTICIAFVSNSVCYYAFFCHSILSASLHIVHQCVLFVSRIEFCCYWTSGFFNRCFKSCWFSPYPQPVWLGLPRGLLWEELHLSPSMCSLGTVPSSGTCGSGYDVGFVFYHNPARRQCNYWNLCYSSQTNVRSLRQAHESLQQPILCFGSY